MISSSFAMQPMQWFRDVAPVVQKELKAEALEEARIKAAQDADQATFELIRLSSEFNSLGVTRQQLIQKVDRLLKRGANPNAVYKYPGLPERKKTIIAAAIENNIPEMVELLLQAGADPDSRSRTLSIIKDSILFEAIEVDNEQIVALLLRYGANPNFKNELEKTPLLLAVEKGNPEIVKLLLQAGADPHYQTLLQQVSQLNWNIRAKKAGIQPILYEPFALTLAQTKLYSTQNETDRQSYRKIIEMLEHPETIRRVGLEKLNIKPQSQKALEEHLIKQEVETIKASEEYKKSAQEAAIKHLEQLREEKQ